MNKIIIFDFNRTLFDPDKQSLMPGCLEILTSLSEEGFKLYLISMAADSRKELIERLDIAKFFQKVIFCEKKTLTLFEQIIDSEATIKNQSFIIGDRVTQEIRFGNELGLNTIWYRNGRFAEELPQIMAEHPSYTVSDLNQIPSLIQDHLANTP